MFKICKIMEFIIPLGHNIHSGWMDWLRGILVHCLTRFGRSSSSLSWVNRSGMSCLALLISFSVASSTANSGLPMYEALLRRKSNISRLRLFGYPVHFFGPRELRKGNFESNSKLKTFWVSRMFFIQYWWTRKRRLSYRTIWGFKEKNFVLKPKCHERSILHKNHGIWPWWKKNVRCSWIWIIHAIQALMQCEVHHVTQSSCMRYQILIKSFLGCNPNFPTLMYLEREHNAQKRYLRSTLDNPQADMPSLKVVMEFDQLDEWKRAIKQEL